MSHNIVLLTIVSAPLTYTEDCLTNVIQKLPLFKMFCQMFLFLYSTYIAFAPPLPPRNLMKSVTGEEGGLLEGGCDLTCVINELVS